LVTVVVVVVVEPLVPAALGAPAPVVAVVVVAVVEAGLSASDLMFASTNDPGASPARKHPVTVTVLSLSACADVDALDDVVGACADSPTAKAAARHVHEIARFIGILLNGMYGSIISRERAAESEPAVMLTGR
jgi:hypothetical protein